MVTYYKEEDGKIILSSTNAEVAAELGLDQQTDQNIVHGPDGVLRFEGTTPQEILDDYAAREKRAERNRFLEETDKYLVGDFPISDELREKYKAYRQYLRDLPASDLFPNVDVLTFEQWHD